MSHNEIMQKSDLSQNETPRKNKRSKKKRCVNCGHKKNAEHFGKQSRFCRYCAKLIDASGWCKKDLRVKGNDRNRKIARYWPDLTRDQALIKYSDLLKSQNYTCALCNADLSETVSHIDHNHATGRVRGILCRTCNVGIGMFKDSQELLIKASVYLGVDQNGIG